MRFHGQEALKALILLAFASLLFKWHYTGEIAKYINTRYEALSQIASLLFVLLFFFQIKRIFPERERHRHDHACERHGCGHHHGTSGGWKWKSFAAYGVILSPLLTGFFLPASTLDAEIAAKKGVMLGAPAPNRSPAAETPPISPGKSSPQAVPESPTMEPDAQRPVPPETPPAPPDARSLPPQDVRMDQPESGKQNGNDDSGEPPASPSSFAGTLEEAYRETIQELTRQPRIVMSEEKFVPYTDAMNLFPEKFQGKPIRIKGFVYKEDGMKEDEFVVARFIITHCIADAGVIGFLARTDDAANLQENTWIEVEGELGVTLLEDFAMPLIEVKAWKKTAPPADPYVYP